MRIQRLVFEFGGAAVAIECDESLGDGILAFLFRYVSRGSSSPPQTTYLIKAIERSNRLALYRGGRLIYAGTRPGVLAERLIGDVCHHLAADSEGGLLLHAAAVRWDQRGVILPGGMGTGKSTVVGWLASRGAAYVTDELVFVPRGLDAVQGFPRPLNLKSPSDELLDEALGLSQCPELTRATADGCLVSPSLLGAEDPVDDLRLDLIIFPRYSPSGKGGTRPMSGAETGRALMECLVNADNLADSGFPEAVRLARKVPAFEMPYAGFGQLEEALSSLP